MKKIFLLISFILMFQNFSNAGFINDCERENANKYKIELERMRTQSQNDYKFTKNKFISYLISKYLIQLDTNLITREQFFDYVEDIKIICDMKE